MLFAALTPSASGCSAACVMLSSIGQSCIHVTLPCKYAMCTQAECCQVWKEGGGASVERKQTLHCHVEPVSHHQAACVSQPLKVILCLFAQYSCLTNSHHELPALCLQACRHPCIAQQYTLQLPVISSSVRTMIVKWTLFKGAHIGPYKLCTCLMAPVVTVHLKFMTVQGASWTSSCASNRAPACCNSPWTNCTKGGASCSAGGGA